MASYDNKVLTGDQLVYFSGLVKTALASKADSSALSGKQDALVFETAYNASTNKVATMSDVNNAANSIKIGDVIAGEASSGPGEDPKPYYLDFVLDDMDQEIRNKQDRLVFNTAYNENTNKVATMSDITSALSNVGSFSFEIVQSLPQSDISTSKIYLVAKQTAGTNQVYTEYAYVNNAWEIIGDTSMTIDTLTNQEVATIWSTATATT